MSVKRLSITFFSVLFSLLLPGFVYAQGNPPKVVSIPDANLAAAVREIIGNSITTHTLLDITGLTVEDRGTENLTGLEHARNLRSLSLSGNAISDILPLSKLTQLTYLHLADNNISDISALAELKNLSAAEWLDVHRHFNINQATFEWTKPTIEMLPPRLASPSNAIRFRFKVTSPNGLHQAHLLIDSDLIACQNLKGKTNTTVDFVVPSLKPEDVYVQLMVVELPSRARVEQWLAAAYHVLRTDARLQQGIDWLQRFLAALPPKETALLTNYPNPFNPETWIPYQLSEPAVVTVHIYSVKGSLVRTLVLGHQPAGMYHRKSRAAYWDGRNAQGEKVASGLYFYTLTADDFTATRKMLIRK